MEKTSHWPSRITLSKVPVKGTVGYVERRGNPHEWGANPCGSCVAAGKIQSLRPSWATQTVSPPASKSRGFQSLAFRKLKEDLIELSADN